MQRARSFAAARPPRRLLRSLAMQIAQIDEQYPNMRPEQLAEELPETAPRFLVVSFKFPKPDGRVQYPLCLIYYCPETCADRNRMMYTRFVNVISKALDITTGWLRLPAAPLKSLVCYCIPVSNIYRTFLSTARFKLPFTVRELRDPEGLNEAWLQVPAARTR